MKYIVIGNETIVVRHIESFRKDVGNESRIDISQQASYNRSWNYLHIHTVSGDDYKLSYGTEIELDNVVKKLLESI